MTVIVGVDPGQTGALATVVDGELVDTFDMPTANGQIMAELLRRELALIAPDEVWIEAVHSMPKQGVSSTFKFGVNYGIALAIASSYPRHLVTPQAWKRSFGLTGKPKDAARGAAINRWPNLADQFARKKDIGRADAAHIALYGWHNKEA